MYIKIFKNKVLINILIANLKNTGSRKNFHEKYRNKNFKLKISIF